MKYNVHGKGRKWEKILLNGNIIGYVRIRKGRQKERKLKAGEKKNERCLDRNIKVTQREENGKKNIDARKIAIKGRYVNCI